MSGIWITLFLYTPDPDWASYKLGVFVCLNCSGVHRSLSNRVKSIKLDFWEDELVEVGTAFSSYYYFYNNILGLLLKGQIFMSNLDLSFFFFLAWKSSWEPTAMPVPELCMRKLFQCTTIGPRKMTVCRYFPECWHSLENCHWHWLMSP